MCNDIEYSTTSFPNGFGHFTQAYAERELEYYSALINTNCSKHIKEYLCASFVPKCSNSKRVHEPCSYFSDGISSMCEGNSLYLEKVLNEMLHSDDVDCYAPPASGKSLSSFTI